MDTDERRRRLLRLRNEQAKLQERLREVEESVAYRELIDALSAVNAQLEDLGDVDDQKES